MGPRASGLRCNSGSVGGAAPDPAFVITLVHGTWADTRGWVAPGSLLRRELEARLGHVVFREFPWISTHTHASRAEAGRRLARFVRGGHALYPGASHFIIGHSHGGMVALYAMRDPAAHVVTSGLITLAAPFVAVRPRRFRPYVRALTFLLVAAPVVAGALVLNALAPLRPFLLAWVLGGAVVTVIADRPLSKWLLALARRWQLENVEALRLPAIDRSRLLILGTRGDEAHGWLRAWDVASHAPFVAAGLLLSMLALAARVLLQARFADAWPAVLAAAAVTTGIVGAGGVLRWPGYGREWGWRHLLVAIHAVRTPDDAGAAGHIAYLFDVPRPSARAEPWRRRLRHKAICHTPSVAAAIAAWIEGGVPPSGASGAT